MRLTCRAALDPISARTDFSPDVSASDGFCRSRRLVGGTGADCRIARPQIKQPDESCVQR